jgi:Fe2+ transport system protein B
MEMFGTILLEGVTGSLRQVWQLALIVVPLMIGMQLLEDFGVMDRLALPFGRLVRVLGLSGRAAFPLLVGLVFGLAYGAGLIIQSARRGDLDRRELILVLTFVSLNHSLFEDTLLFVAIGANGWLLLLIRLVVSVLVTALLARLLPANEKLALTGKPVEG